MLSDEEQIRALVQSWQTATSAGDVDTVLGLMTDDVVFLVSGRPPMRKAEFEALSRVPAGSPRPKFEGTSEIQEIQVSGDMAYLWTKLSVTVTPPGASEPIERAGHTPQSCGTSVASGCWREMQTFCRQSSVRAHDAQRFVAPTCYSRLRPFPPVAELNRWVPSDCCQATGQRHSCQGFLGRTFADRRTLRFA
jgi:uncharacterized protein (TIGR02246 family)